MPVITTLPKPYVGLMGSDNSLQVRRLEDRMVIRLDPGEYFFVVFILVVGGGGLSFLAWYGFPNPHGGLFYTYAKYATGIFAVLLWYILIRYLRGMPRIEVPKGAGEVQFFKYRGGGPEFVIPWSEIQGFNVKVESYPTGRVSYPQYVLYLQRNSGDPVPLCGSVNEELVSGLKTDFERLLGGRRGS